MTAKEELREFVESLTDGEADYVLDECKRLCFGRDPEPLTLEMRAAIERGLAQAKRGELIDLEDVEREFGLCE